MCRFDVEYGRSPRSGAQVRDRDRQLVDTNAISAKESLHDPGFGERAVEFVARNPMEIGRADSLGRLHVWLGRLLRWFGGGSP